MSCAYMFVPIRNERYKYSFLYVTNMEIGEALRLLNGWWDSGKVRKELAKEYKRAAFDEIYNKLTKYNEVIVLTGLRRVGKSTIMYQLIDGLTGKTNPLNIVYFTFDYGSAEIVSILNEYQKITGIDWKKDKIYLFLDEIQILDNWGAQVKLLYDSLPNITFVVSGSASLQLEKRAMDSLAGRHFLIDVPVLSLVEYYSLRHDKDIDNLRLYEGDIGMELDAYIKKPFPELAKIDDQKIIYEYIRESVVAKIISQDLLREFGKVDIPLLNSLAELFFSEPGMVLNVDSLSKSLAKRKQEVERHIYMLEFSKLIRIVKNYRPSTLSESRKLRRVYPYDISLALPQNPSIEKGKVLETLLISRLNIKRYWRDGQKEIDALLIDRKRIIPIEIKASDTLKEDSIKTMEYFVNRFKTENGVLLYNGKTMNVARTRALNIKQLLIYGFDKVIAEKT